MNRLFRRCLTLALVAVFATLTLATPARAGKATIIRDDFGVPHVFAKKLKDTWKAVGYATAQDRLWQMELHRRTALGTLAELPPPAGGAAALAGDVQARALFGTKDFRRGQFGRLSKQTRKIFRAYAKGVNQWIEEATATGQLPPEFQLQGLEPAPWTTDDSVAWGMALLFRFGVGGENEIDYLADLQELIVLNGNAAGPAIFYDSHWVFDPTAPTTIPAGAGSRAGLSAAASAEPAVPDLPEFDARRAARNWERTWRGWERNMKRVGLENRLTSNAIAVAPGLSATGEALLLGGPQQGYSVPQVNHEMGIHGGGFNVTGAAVAGLPGVTIGVNRGLAWTLTTGATDNNDIILETLNSDGTQYLYQGAFRPLDCRVETFNVFGGGVVPQVLCRTVNGPVLQVEGSIAFTLKSASRGQEIGSFETLLGVNRARTIAKAAKKLVQAGHNFNFIAADTRGNIGYYHVGKIPIRAAFDSPFFPHMGDGQAEWQGFIPFAALPQATNPAQGYFVNWNNKPRVNWFNSNSGRSQWGPVDRVKTLMNFMDKVPPGAATVGLLEDANLVGGWTLDTPSGNQSSVPVSTMLPVLLDLVDASADERLPEVLGILNAWDRLKLDLAPRDGSYDSPAVALFNTWWPALIERVFADELGSTVQNSVAANMAARLLIPGLVPLNYPGYLGGETPSGAVTGALISAMDGLTAEFGSADPSTWLAEATMLDWRQIGGADVPDTPDMNRGTYNQITRLEKGDIFAQNVVAPGQSGNPLAVGPAGPVPNPHFADQLGLYATWQYKEMYLTKSALKGHRESRTVLRFEKTKSKKGDK